MKTTKVRTVLLLTVLFSASSYARSGDYRPGNGGDTCENRILEIRNDHKSWITRGSAKDLNLRGKTSLNKYKFLDA